MKTVFVTVGTTKFDPLIKQMVSSDTLEALRDRGFTDLSLQIGQSALDPTAFLPESANSSLQVSYFHCKDSITADIEQADLIISHAGIGSIMDVLSKGKPLLVVVNEELMDNHQTEVAEKLAQDRHLHYCSVGSVVESLRTCQWSDLQPFPPGQPHKLKDFLDEMFGFV